MQALVTGGELAEKESSWAIAYRVADMYVHPDDYSRDIGSLVDGYDFRRHDIAHQTEAFVKAGMLVGTLLVLQQTKASLEGMHLG